jgi:hypothetical protein
MPTDDIQRGPAAGGPPANFQNTPVSNGVYVDGLTNELVVGSGISGATGSPVSAIRSLRTRVAIADVNAGATVLAAVAGRKYRLIDVQAIAVGGAVGATTTVDINGTQGSSAVKLVSFAQTSLTQSAVLRPGSAGVTVLADGASFVQNDVNTAITIGKTGATATGATAIDIALTYALES